MWGDAVPLASLSGIEGGSVNEVEARVRRAGSEWDVLIHGTVIARVGELDEASPRVLAHLDEAEPAVEHAHWRVRIVPEPEALEHAVTACRDAAAALEQARESWIRLEREAARTLRGAGLSAGDCAAILEVPRGRIYQLVASAALAGAIEDAERGAAATRGARPVDSEGSRP